MAEPLSRYALRGLRRLIPPYALLQPTLDAGVQRRLEALAAERAAAAGKTLSVRILAAEHASGRLVASVGSAGLFDTPRDGHVDMTRAIRSPGSTLKPLIYGLAFEAGLAHPESLIEDRPSAFDSYAPTNFDRSFQGTLTVREALQRSLNVPAVRLLDAVGPARLVSRMGRAGARPVLPDHTPAGLAIGLSGIGVSLTDLVTLYAAIARGGEAVALTALAEPGAAEAAAGPARRILDPRAAWYLASILAGAPAPTNAAPDGIAYKTGTSYGHRDAWAIGWDGRHVVGVWIGRPDAAPVPGLTGIDAAAPVLLDAFAGLGPRTPLPGPPPGVLLATHGGLPPTLRWARVPGSDDPAALALKVRNGTPPFTWLANGAPIAREPFGRGAHWTPDGPGHATLALIDGRGRASRVQVHVE